MFFVLIVAFTYFYTAITVRPTQMADDLKVHHQVRLYLLESVENDTYHNQQRCAAEELREILADAEETRECRKNSHYAQEYGTPPFPGSLSWTMVASLPVWAMKAFLPHCASRSTKPWYTVFRRTACSSTATSSASTPWWRKTDLWVILI